MALNKSDLVRYFAISDEIHLPTYIIWVLLERPCILNEKTYEFFFQDLKDMKCIYQSYLDKRTYRRKSGNGDVVNGVHKGVVVNYHYSLSELIRGIDNLIELIKKL